MNVDEKLQGMLYDYSNDVEHLKNQDERIKCRNRYRLKIKTLMVEKEICICAAVKTDDGEIIRGHRHSDCIKTIIANGRIPHYSPKSQGFITSDNRFVGREKGARLQNEAKILSVWTKKPAKNILFSEDLY